MRRCPQCGTEDRRDAPRCSVCGLDLGSDGSTLPPPPDVAGWGLPPPPAVGAEPLPDPEPRRGRPLLVVLLVVVAATVAGGLTLWAFTALLEAPKLEDYDAHGIRFDPPDWRFDEDAEDVTGLELEKADWSDAFIKGPRTLILVTQMDLDLPPVSREDLDAEADAFVESFADGAGLEVTPDYRVIEVGGRPSILMDGPVPAEGETLAQRVAAIFASDVMYLVKCQYAEEDGEETLAACDRILDSFTIVAP